MAPPKKMTLQEFFTDKSLGGSWADDDIDIASISVPIEKHKHYNNHHSDAFSYGSNHLQNGYGSSGPPFIIKLLNLPVTCDDGFVEDLFKSRFTTFVKFKIVVDPISNVLESKIIKKVAFVELSNSQDLQKSLKWMDLYYKDRRRVVIEIADHDDFMYCMDFNQQHAQELEQITEDFIHNKNQPLHRPSGNYGFDRSNLAEHQPHHGGSLSHGPLNPHLAIHGHQTTRSHYTHPLGTRQPHSIHELPPLQPPKPADPPKRFNPFGEAKPVDVVTKLHEIEKKLIMVNHTTIRTMGSIEDDAVEKKSAKKEHVNKENKTPGTKLTSPKKAADLSIEKPKYLPAPVPSSAYGGSSVGMSLAQVLSSKHADEKSGRSSPSKPSLAKPVVSKPTILKKKILSPAIENEVHESKAEVSSQENNETEPEVSETNSKQSTQPESLVSPKQAFHHYSQSKTSSTTSPQGPVANYEPTTKTKDELASILQRNEVQKRDEDSHHRNARRGSTDEFASNHHKEINDCPRKQNPTNYPLAQQQQVYHDESDNSARGGRGRGGKGSRARGRGRGNNLSFSRRNSVDTYFPDVLKKTEVAINDAGKSQKENESPDTKESPQYDDTVKLSEEPKTKEFKKYNEHKERIPRGANKQNKKQRESKDPKDSMDTIIQDISLPKSETTNIDRAELKSLKEHRKPKDIQSTQGESQQSKDSDETKPRARSNFKSNQQNGHHETESYDNIESNPTSDVPHGNFNGRGRGGYRRSRGRHGGGFRGNRGNSRGKPRGGSHVGGVEEGLTPIRSE